MSGLLEQLDTQLSELLSGWNTTSSALVVAIVGFVGWVIVTAKDADTHPLLLARQSHASPVRQPGESAIYRSPEVPHGYPLRTGLQVKPPGAPAYAPGKDGDLRDIWRRVKGDIPLVSQSAAFFGGSGRGAAPPPEPTSQKSKILTVFGKDVEEHDIDELSREINVIGKHVKQLGGKRVALYLPNSVELLTAIFAGAFYGFTVILIPYNQPHPLLISLLNETKADSLIAAAGSLPLEDVTRSVRALKQVLWVVEKTSRHMDWNEVPEGIGGKFDVSTWHDIVQDHRNVTAELKDIDGQKPGNLIFIWQDVSRTHHEIVEFTQDNIVAAVGAAISAVAPGQRMTPSDMFLPADSLTHSYALVLTLAALFSHSTVVLNSVAGTGIQIGLSCRGVAPTVIVASAESAANLHSSTTGSITSGFKKLAHYIEGRALTAGRMPGATIATRIMVPTRAAIGTTPGKLRLVFISERAGTNSPPLTTNDLSDLRIYTGARMVYALTAARVAGAVAQTNVYDYRRDAEPGTKHSHFGIPLSCVEVKLRDTAQGKTTDERPLGEVVVTGPAVAGGETALGVIATFRDDNTLAYV